MQNFIITLIIGILIGFVFFKIKVPGGMMVGAIIGVATFNIFTGRAYMPVEGKVLAQIIAGAFIGSGLEKSDLARLKNIFKPLCTIIAGLLLLNLIMGLLIYFISPLDLTTSFMCAIPGGMSDIPLISEEMGADSAKVAAMQFIRMIFGIGVFPLMILRLSNSVFFNDNDTVVEVYKRNTTSSKDVKDVISTIVVATIFGIVGKILGIPSGTLVFSMVSVIVLKLVRGRAFLPRWIKRIAQVLSGTYIGSGIVYNDVLEIKYLAGPALVLILGYSFMCIFVGIFIHKKFNMSIKDAMLACTPAGASDMALIAADIGVESADLIVIQVIRMIIVISVFPQIVRLITSML